MYVPWAIQLYRREVINTQICSLYAWYHAKCHQGAQSVRLINDIPLKHIQFSQYATLLQCHSVIAFKCIEVQRIIS